MKTHRVYLWCSRCHSLGGEIVPEGFDVDTNPIFCKECRSKLEGPKKLVKDIKEADSSYSWSWDYDRVVEYRKQVLYGLGSLARGESAKENNRVCLALEPRIPSFRVEFREYISELRPFFEKYIEDIIYQTYPDSWTRSKQLDFVKEFLSLVEEVNNTDVVKLRNVPKPKAESLKEVFVEEANSANLVTRLENILKSKADSLKKAVAFTLCKLGSQKGIDYTIAGLKEVIELNGYDNFSYFSLKPYVEALISAKAKELLPILLKLPSKPIGENNKDLVIRWIGKLGCSDAVIPLIALFYREPKQSIVFALGDIGNIESRMFLRHLCHRHPNEYETYILKHEEDFDTCPSCQKVGDISECECLKKVFQELNEEYKLK